MIKPASSIATPDNLHDQLVKIAIDRVNQGLAPPVEIYQIHCRGKIDWSVFPDWAKPNDPEVFDGCCHEG